MLLYPSLWITRLVFRFLSSVGYFCFGWGLAGGAVVRLCAAARGYVACGGVIKGRPKGEKQKAHLLPPRVSKSRLLRLREPSQTVIVQATAQR